MTAREIRQKFLKFFAGKGHTVIPSAPLIPANDPTVLFTTAGMHPLVPYLLGEAHPGGRRVASVQKCIRTGDIDEVGDEVHLTFFEMLGNWSFGDYWKKEAIEWSYEFLTSQGWLGIDPHYLAVSVFAGDESKGGVPRDEESAEIWRNLGIPKERIAYLGRQDNWWGPAGQTGPCGPDTEMFYWSGEGAVPRDFNAKDPAWVEIWNDVFMQYNKTVDGRFEPLVQKNVDTGMGLERTAAVLQGQSSVFETELFQPIIISLREISRREKKNNNLTEEERTRAERIIADHLKAATFIIADGVVPSNKDRGYILRRLIRRAVRHAQNLGITGQFTPLVADVVIDSFEEIYPELGQRKEKITEELAAEEQKFRKTLERGLKEFERLMSHNPSPPPLTLRGGGTPLKVRGEGGVITGKDAFNLFQTYGFPLELTEELAAEYGTQINKQEFETEFKKHQDLSRTATRGIFKGGLADHTEEVIRLHTATHLMQAALRRVLGEHVFQKGSNITKERTRFDFTHDKKMTDEEKHQVEEFVNGWIERDLKVKKEIMALEEARKLGAIGLFGEKYGEQVSIYTVFDPQTQEIISREFCGGPHVEHTGVIGLPATPASGLAWRAGRFKIQKEEAVSAGVRRIKAVLE